MISAELNNSSLQANNVGATFMAPKKGSINRTPTFHYIFRGKKDTIVLIPGWATDYRVFDTLDIKYNYFVPVEFSPPDFAKNLAAALKENNILKVSICGWSMGGFLAAEFASTYPEVVNELILAGIRKKYPQDRLDDIERLLRENKKAYLYKFYNRCFSNKEHMRWFKKELLKSYIDSFDLEYLLKTLDYFKNREIIPQTIAKVSKIKIIHGENDAIAPISEAVDIKNALKQAEFISIENIGHAVFLSKDFKKYI